MIPLTPFLILVLAGYALFRVASAPAKAAR